MGFNVYLDIDGVLLANDLTPANYVHDFLQLVVNEHTPYWLTTHCKGDASYTIRHLAKVLEPETLALLDTIKATNWDIAKTEGIDFEQSFLWFDDDLFDDERLVLHKNRVLDNWIEVDLSKDPNQLGKFIASFPTPINAL